ncbi:T9SS type A sorting domain-containing protein [Chitinophaga sp. NPDC101104]|uniref:T9SS type A sorting domain-containing protein n=1 Tax=Chitinophaga sp. NPDC101104 TaxID=3390561 RepID=UPI003D092F0D
MRSFVTILSILLYCATVKAQIIEEDTVNSSRTAFRDQSFGLLNLTASQIPSGYLLDYSLADFPSEKYDGVGTPGDTIRSYRDFLYLYNILEMAKVNSNGTLIPTDSLYLIANRRKRSGAIPFVFLRQGYQRVSPGALSANLLAVSADEKRLMDVPNRTASPYLNKELFLFAPFEMSITSSEALGFTFPAECWLMPGITAVSVDFGDGAGARSINKGDSVGVYYSTSGTKYITATIQTTSGTRTAKSLIHYTRPSFFFKADQSVSFDVDPVFTSIDQYLDPKASTALRTTSLCLRDDIFTQGDSDIRPGADIQVMLSCDKIFDRPVIILEGFDVIDNVGLGDQFNMYNQFNFLTRLFSQGHDIVFVNLRRPRDFIENNAAVLERVINWVNQNKTGTFRGSVIGFSMGGLIARWCLKDMEDRGIDHKIAHYFSYDAPHQGANIPLGLQYIMREMITDFPFLRWNWPSGEPIAGDLKALLESYDSPAAQQMLVTMANYDCSYALPFTLNPVRAKFASQLAAKGYPQQAVCHGISKGRGNNTAGTRNAGNGVQFGNFGPGHKLFDGQIGYVLVNLQCAAYAVPEGATEYIARYRFSGHSVRRIFGIFVPALLPDIRVRNFKLNGVYPYDDAPGSYEASQTEFMASFNLSRGLGREATNMGHHGHNFIPTASALDLTNQGYSASNQWQSGNMFFNIDNFITPAQSTTGNQLTNPALSPFDFVHTYTSDCGDANIFCQGDNDEALSSQDPDWRFNDWNQYHNGPISNQASVYIVRKILGAFANSDCEQTCANTTQIHGTNKLCTSAIYWVDITSQGVQIVWENLSPSLITLVFGQSSNQIELRRVPNAHGTASIRVTITNPCGISRQLTATIVVGSPSPVFTSVSVDRSGKIIANTAPMTGVNSYNWYLDGAFVKSTTTGSTTMPSGVPCGSEVLLSVEAVDICGTSLPSSRDLITQSCLGAFTVSPNPAKSIVSVQVDSEEEVRINERLIKIAAATAARQTAVVQQRQSMVKEPYIEQILEVKITDIQGKTMQHIRYGAESRSVQIDVSGLASGNYLIQIYNGRIWTSKSIVIVK